MVLVVCFIAGYLPTFQKLLIRWDTGDNSYCYLIIPLLLYICRDKKDILIFPEIHGACYQSCLIPFQHHGPQITQILKDER
ncbi:MAG: hypothetical protein J7K84_00250 [Deltaproteobacteria bacterium]|nr:hypothetical protein [Deltaproteobacteria bacterium]